MPVIAPFWLLYPDPAPVHPELSLGAGLLPPPGPVPPPDPLLLPDPPQPTMTRTWSAKADEQRKEGKSRTMHYTAA
jgi:hypothetical protein